MSYENKHTIYTNYSQKSFWKNGHAANFDEEYDRVELKGPGGGWPSLDFKLPAQRHELEKVERLMQAAYSRGQHDNARAIGKMFKDLISI